MVQARILVVDDELVIRESLGDWLKRDGYYVSTVSSGEKALETLKYNSFDVILLDIQMDDDQAVLHGPTPEEPPDLAPASRAVEGVVDDHPRGSALAGQERWHASHLGGLHNLL